MRFLPNAAFQSAIASVSHMAALARRTDLRVTLHVQGGHAARVPDVDGSVTNFTNWSAYAVGQASRVHAPAASLNVTWRSGPKSAVQVLTAMCDADVVIASPSGFSHLVAVLCKRPLILAHRVGVRFPADQNFYHFELIAQGINFYENFYHFKFFWRFPRSNTVYTRPTEIDRHCNNLTRILYCTGTVYCCDY